MSLKSLLLQLLFFLALANTDSIFIAKPNCQTKCGNLIVPYPFGIGIASGCSMGAFFDVNCDTSFDPPKALISTGKLEIIEISGQVVRIKNWVAATCYDRFGFISYQHFASANITHNPYSFRFDVSDLTDPSYVNRSILSVPMVLEWAVGTQNCSIAQQSDSFACLANSECVDSTFGKGGYWCRCSDGYKGNPYLSPGCIDVDECETKT